MVKPSAGWVSLLFLGNWVGLSVQQSGEVPFSTKGLEMVYQGVTANMAASLDQFMPQLYDHGFSYTKEKFADFLTKTVQCGPKQETINRNEPFNRRYFITSLTPVHHRTETKKINGVRKWKNVFGVKANGILLSWQDGESVGTRISELKNIELTREMVLDAINRCDGHPNGPNHGDCLGL